MDLPRIVLSDAGMVERQKLKQQPTGVDQFRRCFSLDDQHLFIPWFSPVTAHQIQAPSTKPTYYRVIAGEAEEETLQFRGKDTVKRGQGGGEKNCRGQPTAQFQFP